MNNVSKTTLTNITIAWHKIMAKNVAKPNAKAFIIEPNITRMKKSQINDAKAICIGSKYGLSSFGLYKSENKMIPINITPKIEGTKILVRRVI